MATKTKQKTISAAGKKPAKTVTVRSRSSGKMEKYQVRSDGKVTVNQVRKTVTGMKQDDKTKGIKRRYDADAKVTAKTVYPKNPTPAQLSAYRNRPDRRDIEGIDAPRGTANRKDSKVTVNQVHQTERDPEYKNRIEKGNYYFIPGQQSVWYKGAKTSAVELLCLPRSNKYTMSTDQTIAAIKDSKSAKVMVTVPNTICGHSTCVALPVVAPTKKVLALLESLNAPRG
ncbi:MAG: hypothetical protein WCR83_05900, partial [Candidatus Methanomethylophilaceae archaeon]